MLKNGMVLLLLLALIPEVGLCQATKGEVWPSFRGAYASGVLDGQNLPEQWDVETGENIRWQRQIPGLSHASPIIWQEKLFVLTAISGSGDTYLKHGLYGAGDASGDRSSHQWKLLCLNKFNGELIWEAVVAEGQPIDKRHIKATYANSTPATDGNLVVAFLGSQGVFAVDMDGNKLWAKDLGRLNVGAYDAPDYEWGSASSPILHNGNVYLQCDTQEASFLIALEGKTGKILWKTMRDEQPSWGTPTIYPGKTRTELITNSSGYIYSYNPVNGEELWRLSGSSNITAPTPVFKDDILIVASGRRPTKPIFAIRPGGSGDITPDENSKTDDFILWRKTGRGPYMPTPIIYGDLVFMLLNQGILDCYDLKTGEELFRKRLRHTGGGFSASPVAADGKLFLSGEDGDIFVVGADSLYKEIAVNNMNEVVMASPAISEGILYIRGKEHLFAISR